MGTKFNIIIGILVLSLVLYVGFKIQSNIYSEITDICKDKIGNQVTSSGIVDCDRWNSGNYTTWSFSDCNYIYLNGTT